MKRLTSLMVILVAVFSLHAQQKQSLSNFVPSDVLTEYLTSSQIDSMLTADPAGLLRMNRTIYSYAMVIDKLWEEDFNDMGYLDQYLPQGMKYSEQDIIEYGCINPYIWKLPMDKSKFNLFKLHRSGYYVVVMSESEMEARVRAYMQQFGF